MFVNERSLVTVAVPVREVENLFPYFRLRVENLLLMLDIEQEVIDREISHLEPVQFARTASRSLLGSMNDIAWNYQYKSEEAEYVSRLSLSDAELKLSMMPSGVLDYQLPAEVAIELLEGSSSRAS